MGLEHGLCYYLLCSYESASKSTEIREIMRPNPLTYWNLKLFTHTHRKYDSNQRILNIMNQFQGKGLIHDRKSVQLFERALSIGSEFMNSAVYQNPLGLTEERFFIGRYEDSYSDLEKFIKNKIEENIQKPDSIQIACIAMGLNHTQPLIFGAIINKGRSVQESKQDGEWEFIGIFAAKLKKYFSSMKLPAIDKRIWFIILGLVIIAFVLINIFSGHQ